jgi:ATP synthase protein I
VAVFGLRSRPLRAALAWQLACTAIVASLAALFGGLHASASVALGGGSIVAANIAYALVVGLSAPRNAGATVRVIVRAESVKIALIVLELWLVFSAYRDLVPLAFVGAFVLAVLIWPVALLYKD